MLREGGGAIFQPLLVVPRCQLIVSHSMHRRSDELAMCCVNVCQVSNYSRACEDAKLPSTSQDLFHRGSFLTVYRSSGEILRAAAFQQLE